MVVTGRSSLIRIPCADLRGRLWAGVPTHGEPARTCSRSLRASRLPTERPPAAQPRLTITVEATSQPRSPGHGEGYVHDGGVGVADGPGTTTTGPCRGGRAAAGEEIRLSEGRASFPSAAMFL